MSRDVLFLTKNTPFIVVDLDVFDTAIAKLKEAGVKFTVVDGTIGEDDRDVKFIDIDRDQIAKAKTALRHL